MQSQARVTIYQAATGRVGLVSDDGSHVLAEQLGTEPLEPGQLLQGVMQGIGIETWVDATTQARYEVFVQAYGLSAEALAWELR